MSEVSYVMFLCPGETPWNNQNSGEIPGPWPDDEDQLRGALKKAGLILLESWRARGQVWVKCMGQFEKAWSIEGVLTWGTDLEDALGKIGLYPGDVPEQNIEAVEL